VMTYALSPQRSHIEILGKKALLYKGKKDLEQMLLSFHSQVQHERNWDAYSQDFLPNSVMSKFEQVFLNNHPQTLQVGALDTLAIQRYRFQRKLRNLSKKLY